MELVSIIIPAYNTANLIGRCLNSVVGQTYANLEIIVVNDASTDNTLEVVNNLAKKDNRISIIDFKSNKGNGIGRNTSIKLAKGKYVYFVDSDDYIELDAIELLQKKSVEDQADVVILGHKEDYKCLLGKRKNYK